MLRTRFIRMAAVLAIVVLASACGGDESSTPSSVGTETSGGTEPVGSSSAEEYATGVCTAINDWITSLTASASDLSQLPTDAAAGQAVMLSFLDGVITETDALLSKVEALGVPDTADGEAASAALLTALTQVRDLYQGLRDSVADLDTADPAAFATALTELSTGLDAGSGDVGSALDEFQNGELAATFQATPACAALTGS
ncbi:MAG TPA: hypothetical protein VGR41_02460 [Actinomycetota bacterium]|jgi:hypothetical protein|nr:hypothetical protein [Actinomycetota bacterium]